MKMGKILGYSSIWAVATLVFGGAMLSCNNPTEPQGGWPTPAPASWSPVYRCLGGVDGGLDLGSDDLGLGNAIVVKFNGAGTPTVEGVIGSSIAGGHVTLSPTDSATIVVSGAVSNGSLNITKTEYRTALYLNGVSITNPQGPAIDIQSSKRTTVFLVGGECGSGERRNILQDGAKYDPEPGKGDPKGTFFSEGSLVFSGNGTLEIRAKFRNAIVSKEYINVGSGGIFIHEAVNDGIHANEDINISGGELQIKCEGDAIQSEKPTFPVTISGGKVTVRTTGVKGHGIVSDTGDVIIEGSADVNISLTGNGSKGIKVSGNGTSNVYGNVRVKGGSVYINAYGGKVPKEDDPRDTSAAAGIKAESNVEISGGELTIECVRTGQKSKGLNVDNDVTVSGGVTKIRADGDGVKVRGAFKMTAGSLYARSWQSKDIDYDETKDNDFGGNFDAGKNTRLEGKPKK